MNEFLHKTVQLENHLSACPNQLMPPSFFPEFPFRSLPWRVDLCSYGYRDTDICFQYFESIHFNYNLCGIVWAAGKPFTARVLAKAFAWNICPGSSYNFYLPFVCCHIVELGSGAGDKCVGFRFSTCGNSRNMRNESENVSVC